MSSTGASRRSRSRAARRTSGGARTTSRTCSATSSSSSSTTAPCGSRPSPARRSGSSSRSRRRPVIALVKRLDETQARAFHRAFVELYESYREPRRWRSRAAPLPARPRHAQVNVAAAGRVVELLQRADPPRHDESARQRDPRRRAAARLPRGRGRRVRALRARAGAGEPGRAHSRSRRRPVACAALAHRRRAGRSAASGQHEPFAADLVDGEVWGRGALDMKGEVAASAVALATLAREGWRGSGDLIFVAAADEEVGDGFGLQWLVDEHPDAVRADFSVNEGGGDRVELGGSVLYLCSTAEKMSSPFVLRVHGRSGHASMPAIADNALVKAAPFVERLGAFAVEPRLIPEVDGVPRGACSARFRLLPARSLLRARSSPLAGELVEPLLAMTVSPTKAHASDKRNVIPALCEITIDVRLLPGQTPAEAEDALRAWLGTGRLRAREHRRHRAARGRRSAARSGTRSQSFVDDEEPGARPAPMCVAGFTDSHWVREAFGTVAYGFFPARALTRARRPADPLRRRARAGVRPRARRALPAPCRDRPSVLELHDADGALEALEAVPGRRAARRARRRRLPRLPPLGDAAPRAVARAARAVPAAGCWPPGSGPPATASAARAAPFRVGEWEPTWAPEELRRRRRRGARGDRARRRLPGQPRAAPLRARSRATRTASPPRSRRCARSIPRPFAGDGWAIVSASPELFLARRGDRLWTMPIKGTRPIGEDVDDAKDAAEHVMIVDLERNDLSRVCRVGIDSLARADGRSTSSRASRISSRPSRAGCVPAPAWPRSCARRSPAARSPGRRRSRRSTRSRGSSRSGAARRWARSGRCGRTATSSFALTIRTFAVAGGRIHLWVGGGIVWDSEPEAEIEESWVKARPLLAAVERQGRGLTLLAVAVAGRGLVDPEAPVFRADDEALLRGGAAFETLRVYGGRPFLLDRHLERLRLSVDALALAPPAGVDELIALVTRRRAARPRASALPHRARRSSVDRRGAAARASRSSARAASRCAAVEVGEPPPLLAGAKTTSYGLAFAARREAERHGADDALLVGGRPRARGRHVERLVASRRRALHTRCGRRCPAGRHARVPRSARAGRRGPLPARRPARGGRGLHDLVDPRGDAGRRGRRTAVGDGRPGPAAARLQAALRLRSVA